MTDQVKLTTRQFEALEATLYGQHSHYRKAGTKSDGTPYWRSQTNMGGAVTRMLESLHDAGLLQKGARSRLADDLCVRYIDAPRMSDQLLHDYGGLSVKGLEALRSYLSGKQFDPTDERQSMINDQLPKRRELDAAYDAFLINYRERDRSSYERKQAAQRKALVAEVRGVLARNGYVANAKTDAEVRQFVRDIDDAKHGLAWVRYLDDTDLSAELDDTQKQAVVPGTIGDTMRAEKLAAIRAEFSRRTGEQAA